MTTPKEAAAAVLRATALEDAAPVEVASLDAPVVEVPKTVEQVKAADPVQMMLLMQNMMMQMQRISDDNAALRAQMVKMQEPEEDLDDTPAPVEKTYYHPTEGSTIIISRKGLDGTSIAEVHTFWGGKITTQDRVVQRYLDQICDTGSSPVSSRPVRGRHKEMDAAAAQVIAAAQRSIDKVVGRS